MSFGKINNNLSFNNVGKESENSHKPYIKSLHENRADEVSFKGKSVKTSAKKTVIGELLRKAGIIKPEDKPEVKYNKELLKKVKELQKQGYLANFSFKRTLTGARINPEAGADIEKLYLYMKGEKTLEELFTPSFEDDESAAEALKTGDTCIIGDEKNISIKTKDGGIEHLNLSPETYMKLFPPGHRYAFCQQKSGDCYLISSLYSLCAAPETRSLVLSCFNENPDGTLDIKFPEGKTSVNYDLYGYDKKYFKDEETVTCCDGIKALEYAYGREISSAYAEMNLTEVAESQTGIKDTLDYFNNTVMAKLNKIAENLSDEGTISVDDLTRIEFNPEEGEEISQDMKNLTLLTYKKFIEETEEEGIYKLDIDKLTADKIRIRDRELKVYQSTIDNHKDIDISDYANKERGSGGFCKTVFTKFGLPSKNIPLVEKIDNEVFEDFQTLKKDLDKTDNSQIFMGSTGLISQNDNFWSERHSYIIKPEKTSDGETVYRVTNPWNTAFSIDLTKEELFKRFFFITKVETNDKAAN